MPLFKCSASKAKPKNGIRYITDPKKAAFVSAKNLFEDEDYAKQFEETAKRFGKGEKFDERKYYHFKLSCARKDNVTPRRAHDFAEEVAEAFFKNYECVIATHTDTETVHSHIIVNAVDPITGKKLQFGKAEYAAMKDEVNRIGKEHGYTETDFRKRSKNSRTPIEKKIILKGGTSWKEELREVVAEAVKKTNSLEAFKKYLDECYGIKITRDCKDYSYLHPEKQKPVRGAKLGENYTKTEVIKRIGEQNYRQKSGAYTGRRYIYLYVKGDFEPIISEEQWDRCRQIREQRVRRNKILTENGVKSHLTGVHTSDDVWTKKLRCRCGYRMRRNKWRKNRNGELIYGYKCYASQE